MKSFIMSGIAITGICVFSAITGVSFFAGTYTIIQNLVFGVLVLTAIIAFLFGITNCKEK